MCGKGLIPEASALMGKYWVLPEQGFLSNLSIMCFGQPLSPDMIEGRGIGDNVINFDTIKGVITQSWSHSTMIGSCLSERIPLQQDLWAISSLRLSMVCWVIQSMQNSSSLSYFIPDLLQPFFSSVGLKHFFTWTLPAINHFLHSSSCQSIRLQNTWKEAGSVITGRQAPASGPHAQLCTLD